MELKDLLPAALVLVVTGIGVSVGATILSTVSTTQTGTAADVTKNATAGLSQLGSWFPTIGLIVAAAVVIGILVGAFYYSKA